MKNFYISYQHSTGSGLRVVRSSDESSAISKAQARVFKSDLHSNAHNFESVSRSVANRIAKNWKPTQWETK